MHVNTKKLTLSGICMAVAMAFILIESVFGMSTLFLLGIAGFMIGIIIREAGFKYALIYFAASVLLSVIIAPDKLKLVTFFCAEIYILLRERVWEFLVKDDKGKYKKLMMFYTASKLVFFNLMAVPIILIFPELIMENTEFKWKLIALVAANPVWYVADRAYDYFQAVIWSRIRRSK